MSREKGALAEAAAAEFLEMQGYQIVARNYTVRGGEIDIIARDGDYVVFVEVKSGATSRYGAPRERVTRAKRRRICTAALRYLQENGLSNANVRFDVIEKTPAGLTLLRAAFPFVEP